MSQSFPEGPKQYKKIFQGINGLEINTKADRKKKTWQVHPWDMHKDILFMHNVNTSFLSILVQLSECLFFFNNCLCHMSSIYLRWLVLKAVIPNLLRIEYPYCLLYDNCPPPTSTLTKRKKKKEDWGAWNYVNFHFT